MNRIRTIIDDHTRILSLINEIKRNLKGEEALNSVTNHGLNSSSKEIRKLVTELSTLLSVQVNHQQLAEENIKKILEKLAEHVKLIGTYLDDNQPKQHPIKVFFKNLNPTQIFTGGIITFIVLFGAYSINSEAFKSTIEAVKLLIKFVVQMVTPL